MEQRHAFHLRLGTCCNSELVFKSQTGKKINGDLADVYGSSASSYAQVNSG